MVLEGGCILLIFLCVCFVDILLFVFVQAFRLVLLGPSLPVTQTLLIRLGFRLLGAWAVSMIQSSVLDNM